MTREVEVTISGLQGGTEERHGQIETVVSAEYFKKNDSHYLFYEEKVDGFAGVFKSRIKCSEKMLELTRRGKTITHMIFEENKKHATEYMTPYGSLLLDIHTKKVQVEEQTDHIRIVVEYLLEEGGNLLSENIIEIQIGERP